MPLPAAPEYDAVNSQLAALKQISAGLDWHTDLGAGAGLYPISGESPVLSCWPLTVDTGVDPESGMGAIVTTWTATVPLDEEDSTQALYVLADMRAALVTDCSLDDPHELAATMSFRDPGSKYATVIITVETSMISTGRA